ncbi:hypothetical protein KP509_12G091000 [Ceratopteris richardii]|uniref:Uncharacterized protein n=1 Tax=Ceratopteris richardii TaxID=49495 RepID=A0A8T2TQR7_CERRI|nr:hypothetical protein KP509_12G091000 [Ceratopteris richardii]
MIEASSEEESRTEDSKVAARKKLDDKVEISSPSELLSKQTDWNEVTERQGSSVKQSKVKSGVKTLSSVNLKRLTTDRDGGHFEGVEEELNKLVDENGSLRKGQPAVATTYLKLLVRTSASSAMAAEGSRSIRDISLVLDALLKTQSRAILLEISSIHGFQVLHKMLKQSKKDYKRTPIIRKLLKVLEFLAARRILTMEQINAEPSRSDMESVKDTIFGLCRHGDVEVQKMARHFKDKYLKASSQKLSRRGQGPSDLSKWRLFHKQTQQGSSGTVADDNTKKRKRASRWDQPSQEVLDTTTAGGLPQSFWPFNANNLLVGNSQQSDGADPQVRQNEGASRDEFGALHPGPPLTDKHPPDAVPVTPGVVSGIPVEQFSAGTSMGYMAQQGPICIGIPVSQFHSGSAPLEFPYVPQIVASTCQVAHPHGEQVSPLSSNPANMQDHIQHKTDGQSKNKIIEESKMTFGISHSQFFRQMHGMFGSTFHPWQLQSLMAAHAWGPFLAGDARIREYNNNNNNDPGMPFRQPNQYRGTEESVSKPLERSGGVGYAPEVEPCVPGLSPPLPPPLPQLAQPPLPVQTPKHTDNQPFIADERLGRINIQHQQFKPTSWRPHQRWNSPKWPKFQGNNRNRSPGVRRDHNYMQRPYRPNFGRQGGHMRPHNWEGSSPWKHSDRNWGFSDAQGMDQETSTEVLDGGQNAMYGSPYQDTGNSSGSMPLEKPWGYGQQYPNGDPNNYSANVPQEGVNDTFNSWGANNQ